MIRINQIKLPVQHTEQDLQKAICKVLRKPEIKTYTIIKQSLDARDKQKLHYSYSVEISETGFTQKEIRKLLTNKNIMLTSNKKYDFASQISHDFIEDKPALQHPPIIVGTGPAGLFCGYQLAKAGYHPILLERGMNVEHRVREIQSFWDGGNLNPDCNVQFGEGGAGTFSDGKLNTMIHDKTGRIGEVLRTFVSFGAPEDILYVNKPHIGTDRLRDVVKNMRNEIIRLGGQVLFQTCLTDIAFEKDTADADRVCSVTVKDAQGMHTIPCDCLVLAIGHSARDTFELLQQRAFRMSPKAFAVGLRIEHPAEMIRRAQYGDSPEAKFLPAADYKLTHQTEEGRAVYSFCMCPGGHIVNASSEPGMTAVNGMSYRARNARNSNSAIVVNITPEDFNGTGPLAGMEFQRYWERAAYQAGNGKVPLQLFGDYRRNQISTSYGTIIPDIKGQYAFANLNDCLPKFVNNAIIKGVMAFDHRIPGFASEDAVLCGIESRTSSPVRIERNEEFYSNYKGIYPCGEGAGYAGGITSAAVDGIKVAEAIAVHTGPSL